MARIRSRDTRPELAVRALLTAAGVRGYRLHAANLPGRPDIVVPRERLAIFVHGCHWHRHACPRGRFEPRTNAAFWAEKFARNVARDRRARRALNALGWRVLVIWECRLRDPERVARRLARAVRGGRVSEVDR